MKNYSDEIFVEQLRLIIFPNNSNYTCVKYDCQDFCYNVFVCSLCVCLFPSTVGASPD